MNTHGPPAHRSHTAPPCGGLRRVAVVPPGGAAHAAARGGCAPPPAAPFSLSSLKRVGQSALTTSCLRTRASSFFWRFRSARDEMAATIATMPIGPPQK